MSKLFRAFVLGLAAFLLVSIFPVHAATQQVFSVVVSRQDNSIGSLRISAVDMASAIHKAVREPGVVHAEPDVLYHAAKTPNDPNFSQQTALDIIGAPTVWDSRTDSSSVVVAVLDSGVDITNPDLEHSIWTNAGEVAANGLDDDGNGFVDDVHGWSFIEGTNDPRPKVTPGATVAGLHHGTVIAGIVGAEGNNNIAGAGVSWKASILPVRVLDSTGSGSTVTVAQGIRYAVAAGAKIINLSFVGEGTSTTLSTALTEARSAGVIVVAAAGNEGVDLDVSPRYPVCYDGVFGVASVSSADSRSSFSNYGSCVDIAAPGENVYSTFYYSPNDGYTQVSGGGWYGTSVASPFVAGSAALLRATNPDLSVEAVETLLKKSAVSLSTTEPTYVSKLGAGRLSLVTLLDSVQLAQFVKHNLLTFPLKGDTPRVREFDSTGKLQRQFVSNKISVRADGFVSSGNLLGDDNKEFVTSFGKGTEPRIRIYNRLGQQVRTFLSYPQTYRGGVVHAIGDLDGDGIEEIVVGTATGSAQIRIFNSSGVLQSQFFAFVKNYTGGVRLAVADVDGNGVNEIIVSKFSKDPRVAIFSEKGSLIKSFRVLPSTVSQGSTIAAGDVTGDGKAEIVIGQAAGSPRIRIFNALGSMQREFYAFASTQRSGVTVAIGDVNGDGIADIITGSGPGVKSEVRVFTSLGRTRLLSFFPYGAKSTTGVSVAAVDR